MKHKRKKVRFFNEEEFLAEIEEIQNDYVDRERPRGKALFFTDEPVLTEAQDVQKGYRDNANKSAAKRT